MGKSEALTPVLGLKYVRWPDNRSVQQFACCMAAGCLMAVGRMWQRKGKPFDPQLGARFEKVGWDITCTCGKHVAPMSAGVQRSLLHAIQTIVEACPGVGSGLVEELTPRMIRIIGTASWPLVDDAARLCPVWVAKAKGLWREAHESLWAWVDRECSRFPSIADEGWMLTEKVMHAGGYCI